MLNLTVKRPDGTGAFKTEKEVTAIGGDTYGQLLKEGIEFNADATGMLKIEAVITSKKPGIEPLAGSDEINVVDVRAAPVALIESDNELAHTLKNEWSIDPQKLDDVPANKHLDVIVLSTKMATNDLFKVDKSITNVPMSQNLGHEGQAVSGQVKIVSATVQTQSGISPEEFEGALKRYFIVCRS